MNFMSEDTEPLKTKTLKKERAVQMSDVATAQSFIEDIGGGGRVNVMLHRAYKRLNELFPHEKEPHKQWTERRLKGWFYRESENVLHWQMLELYEAATKAKNERELIRKARKEHAEFIEKTARMAAFLEHQDEDFNCDQVGALRRELGHVDRAGDSGD